ncbi:hypothetical protein D9M70_431130 [compost metagenome]
MVTSSVIWRTSAWSSWLRPAWTVTNLMKTWALPSSFSIIALLLCSEVSPLAACRAESSSSRLALKASTCSASDATGARPCTVASSSCSRVAMRFSRSPDWPDWPIIALISTRSLRLSRPRRKPRLAPSRSRLCNSERVLTYCR